VCLSAQRNACGCASVFPLACAYRSCIHRQHASSGRCVRLGGAAAHALMLRCAAM
jgi:hypothetical protein